MNPLTDLLPARVRAYLYAVVAVVAFLYGLWLAANGSWAQFAAAVITALTGALAGSNVTGPPYDPKHD